MSGCHTCSQLSIKVTRAQGDLLGVTKALSRAVERGRPTGRLMEQLAAAKAAVRNQKDQLDQHARACEVAS